MSFSNYCVFTQPELSASQGQEEARAFEKETRRELASGSYAFPGRNRISN